MNFNWLFRALRRTSIFQQVTISLEVPPYCLTSILNIHILSCNLFATSFNINFSLLTFFLLTSLFDTTPFVNLLQLNYNDFCCAFILFYCYSKNAKHVPFTSIQLLFLATTIPNTLNTSLLSTGSSFLRQFGLFPGYYYPKHAERVCFTSIQLLFLATTISKTLNTTFITQI